MFDSMMSLSRRALGCASLLAAIALPAWADPVPTVPPPSSLLPGFQVEWVQVAEAPHSIGDAYNALAGVGFTVLDRVTEFHTFINLSDASAPFAGADPFFAVRVTGYISLPAADTYTFLSIHDDGIRVVVGGEEVILFPGDTGAIETDSAPFALAAGVYSYEAVGWEQGGVFLMQLGIDSVTTGRVFLPGLHVPQPATLALVGLALVAGATMRRRRGVSC